MARSAWLVTVPLAFVAAFFLLPMGLLLGHGLDKAHTALSPGTLAVLRIAVTQAVWSTLLALAIAVPLAWAHHARRHPASRVQLALHAAPFVMPVFVVVYGLQGILGPHGWTRGLVGLDVLSWLGPFGAVVLAHAYYNYGFAARLLEANLASRPRTLEAAARTLGASPRQAFLRATLPLLWPAVAAVGLLVFLFTFGSYGVVLLLGEGRVRTLETAMQAYVTGGSTDLGAAAVLGGLQLAINAALLLGYLALRRRLARAPAEAPWTPPRAHPAWAAAAWIGTALALLPIVAVLVQGFRVQGAWSLEPWRFLLSGPRGFDLGHALRLSVGYALASTALAVALTACLAYGARRIPGLRRPLEAVASLPVAGTGVLLGAAFVASFGAHGLVDLAGTTWIVLAAHTVLAFPFVARLLLPAFDAMDPRLEESARLLGAAPAAVLARVHWPLLRPALVAAAGLAIALSLADFGASSILMTTETRSLSVWIDLVAANRFDPVQRAASVALAGLLCALTLLAYLAVERVRVGVAR